MALNKKNIIDNVRKEANEWENEFGNMAGKDENYKKIINIIDENLNESLINRQFPCVTITFPKENFPLRLFDKWKKPINHIIRNTISVMYNNKVWGIYAKQDCSYYESSDILLCISLTEENTHNYVDRNITKFRSNMFTVLCHTTDDWQYYD